MGKGNGNSEQDTTEKEITLEDFADSISEEDLDAIDQEVETELAAKESEILNRLDALAKEHNTEINRIWYIELIIPLTVKGKALNVLYFKRPTRKDSRYYQAAAKKLSQAQAEDLWAKSMSYDGLSSDDLDNMDTEDYSKITKKLMNFMGLDLRDFLPANS